MTAEQNIDVIQSEGTEIARYRTSTGTRVLRGRRTPSGVVVTDHPASGRGRSYYVDGGFHELSHLTGFVTYYLEQAALLDTCPISPASPTMFTLAAVAAC